MSLPSKIKKRHLLDLSIFIPYLVLCIIGLIMVYSSTSYKQIDIGLNPAGMVKNQLVFWVLSLFFMLVIYRMKTKIFQMKGLMNLAMAVTGLLLCITLMFGEEINGAKGWLSIGSFNMQPAEYLKILIVWYLAYRFSKRQPQIGEHDIEAFKGPLAITLGFIALVAIQPDMGNAVILGIIMVIMILVSGISYKWTAVSVPTVVFLGVLATEVVLLTHGKVLGPFQYIYKRFQAFATPFAEDVVRDAGHQLVNSYYAINNGGWFGLGLGNSIEKKGYLPEAHTDFIFSIVVEELGVVAALLILFLLVFMICRMLLVGIRAHSAFNSMMAIGIGSMFLVQLFINVGGIVGLIPSTGVTFPFLSQGGNSLLVLSVSVGFVLNVSADEQRYRIETESQEVLKRQSIRRTQANA
jgi:cell division protein FtsW